MKKHHERYLEWEKNEKERKLREASVAQQKARPYAPTIAKAIPPHLQYPIPSTVVSSQVHQSQAPLGNYLATRHILTDEEARRNHMSLLGG